MRQSLEMKGWHEMADPRQYANGDPRNPCNYCGETRGRHLRTCDAPRFNANAPHEAQLTRDELTKVAIIAAYMVRDGRAPSARQAAADMALAQVIGAPAAVDAIMTAKGGRR